MSHDLELEVYRETVAAEPAFDELLEFVVDATLDRPGRLQELIEREQPSPEDPVYAKIQRLGLWAVSYSLRVNDAEEDDLPVNNAAVPLPFDKKIQAKIEAYGEALLEEAFACLGDDANDKIEEYKNAKTDAEAQKVCIWLIRRIMDIRSSTKSLSSGGSVESGEQAAGDGGDEGNNHDTFYHPARLSPKFIGKYPENTAEPTCLGYSILVASFFHKAGAPFMHAGVLHTAKDEARASQGIAAFQIIRAAQQMGVTMPEEIGEKLVDVFLDATMPAAHNGFHAAILARFPHGTWIQVDTNYSNNIVLKGDYGDSVQEAYVDLMAKQIVATGIEHRLVQYDSYVTSIYAQCIESMSRSQTVTVQDIDAFLLNLTRENFYAEIVEKYFGEFFDEEGSDNALGLSYAIDEYCARTQDDRDEYLHAIIFDTLLDYVFTDAPNEDIGKCIERCKTDDEYRNTAAEALKLAPLYALLKLNTHHGDAVIADEIKYPHCVMDVGTPAYRIGACVLSDFAVYCGDELPLSFWMTYWPSQVSFAEHHTNAQTPAQAALKGQLVQDIKTDDLKYPIVRGIVSKSNE